MLDKHTFATYSKVQNIPIDLVLDLTEKIFMSADHS